MYPNLRSRKLFSGCAYWLKTGGAVGCIRKARAHVPAIIMILGSNNEILLKSPLLESDPTKLAIVV